MGQDRGSGSRAPFALWLVALHPLLHRAAWNPHAHKVGALLHPPPHHPFAWQAGENLRLRLTGCEDSDISQGFVLCSIKIPVPMVTQFEAQLVILELLEHNPIFTVGYR